MASSHKLVHDALEANKVHQAALIKYAQDLATEIEELDSFIDNIDGLENDGAQGLTVHDSPFHLEASRQDRYNRNTTPHPIKGKELDALTDAIQRERQRVQSLKRQRASEQDTHNDELNWTAIAERVSMASCSTRTADECRIKFEAGFLNGGGATVQEHRTLRQHVWSAESDQKLKDTVQRYGFNNWAIVARHVSENATASQCEGRFSRMFDLTVKRDAWTAEEDTRLGMAVEAYGHSWVDVAVAVAGRTNDQCRDRWLERQRAKKRRSTMHA